VRHLKNVTDNEIVDAFAEYGVHGMGIHHLGVLADRLGVDQHATSVLEQRMYDMCHGTNRLTRPGGDDVYALTWIEWGRRLAGQPAEIIAVALGGT
jgi:hypothetical protein